MKKIIVPIFIVFLTIGYIFQQNPMVTGEAIVHSIELMQNPSEEWVGSISPKDLNELKGLPPDNVKAILNTREGLWYNILNRKQWEVTIKFKGNEPTVVFDATTGKLIDLYGPLN
ncbi:MULTISPECIES: hypothetical protein [unclassified Mesobacillus]|uniref:hypothetical protein n=1 Tax=unclassified Mesobacillus TaxID=2675270 RepID=UPI002042486A|nr:MULTISPECIES: hypothetical protein [unclassified Mesobacillus]MCM3125998.1 hypothetical protein [Mesobacillus sp. MER 33]MCM3235984.1 hypothetical protein [Mesobacillus sp. MER 48]